MGLKKQISVRRAEPGGPKPSQPTDGPLGHSTGDLLQALFDAVAEGLMLVEDAQILFANSACARLFGYSNATEMSGLPLKDMLSLERRFCLDMLKSPSQTPCEHPSCEKTIRRLNGEVLRVQVQCTHFQHTDRALLLIALRESSRVELGRVVHDDQRRFQTIFEGAAIGIVTAMLDGRIIESNPALTKMLGYSREEFAGMHARDLHPGDFEQDEQLLKELMQGVRESYELEKRFRKKDGSYIWGQLTISLVRDRNGEPAFVIGMLEDTTARKRAEEQLREAAKMEVIGRLAGGVAHDFNNILTGILLYCDLLLSGISADDPKCANLDEIRIAAEQGAALTQQLLSIARKQITQLRPVQLNEVLASTEKLLRRLIGEQIELVSQPAPDVGIVLADPAQLRQVILNLTLNARDAMPQGGRITISTHATAMPDSNGPAISLAVEDTGSGMDAETRSRLFEPFFTTKKPGHGTGLGLATVQRIVKETGGQIEVKSEAERGTKIEVFLPLMEADSEAASPVAQTRSSATILLVDDHTSARDSIHQVLDRAGYQVLQASSGKGALEVFEKNPNKVDLLIADWSMPGMSGHELTEKLRKRHPRLKALLISGYQDTIPQSESLPVALVRKPFAGHVLIDKIREVLDS